MDAYTYSYIPYTSPDAKNIRLLIYFGLILQGGQDSKEVSSFVFRRISYHIFCIFTETLFYPRSYIVKSLFSRMKLSETLISEKH